MASIMNKGFSGQLLAYAASETAAKVSRLFVVVAVARTLDAEAIGIAAAALAAGDILKALTENGVGQRIISSPDDELTARCNTARRIFWIWCGALFVAQLAIAGLFLVAGHAMMGLLLALLAVEYLFMPAGLVQAALAMREGKLRQTAAIAGGQVVFANIITTFLAVLWASPLAMVVPRILSAPIWLILIRRLRPWVPQHDAPRALLRPFWDYGVAVLGVEVVKVMRLQADKLVVGAMLGPEMLGIYFMAFNAGLGLATSFTQAFSVVLFPHLCAADDRLGALRQGLAVTLALLAPLVILQASLAPFYVPMLLGPAWEQTSHLVSILCLAALPNVIWSACASWLRVEGQPQKELLVSVLLAVVLILNSMLLAPFGLTVIAIGYLLLSLLIMLSATAMLLPSRSAVRKATT